MIALLSAIGPPILNPSFNSLQLCAFFILVKLVTSPFADSLLCLFLSSVIAFYTLEAVSAGILGPPKFLI